MSKKKVDTNLLKKLRKSPPPIVTVVNFILDQSGSMGAMSKSVISGFNEYIGDLKKKQNILMSLTLFDTNATNKPYIGEPIANVQDLDDRSYRPNGGTPLYDAVCNTVEDAEKKLEAMGEKYASVVVIMTDGEENSSQQYSQKDFLDLKKRLEKNGNWTFVFMGANQDAWATAQSWGFSQGNTMNWQASAAGAKSAFRSLADNTVMYSAAMNAGGGAGGGVLNTAAFFEGSNDTEVKGN